VNFHFTVLRVLSSYPQGFAVLAEVKRDVEILYTSGQDWAERTRRVAKRVPDLNIFTHGLVERRHGGWQITEKGREILSILEAPPAWAKRQEQAVETIQHVQPSITIVPTPRRRNGPRQRPQRVATARRW